MKKNNIILIGMPGCGKSTLGVVLAKMLCLDFLDLDLVIQKRIGMTLQDYIDKNGVDAFLELEADIANTLECENTVLATGGSAVLRERAAKHLKTLGKTVYISLPLEDIEKRTISEWCAMADSFAELFECNRDFFLGITEECPF